MPTFFARRYMRNTPSAIERVIGISILVLLVLIVAAFLLTSGLLGEKVTNTALARGVKTVLGISDKPLFQIDPAHLGSAPADDKRVAAQVDVPATSEPATSGPSVVPVPSSSEKALKPVAPPAAPTIMAVGQARFVDLGDADILPPDKTERFTDNLYEKIDGREGQFRAFYFVELRFGLYADARNNQTFDVYLYDMAEPANALGIYMSERSGEVQAIDIGRDGYVSGTSVYFWKGRYYVYVLGPVEGNEETTRTSERIAKAIAATIADEGRSFWADALLPKEERVPRSLSYRATSALGYEFLNQMFVADYKSGEKTYQLYILKTDRTAAARELFVKLADATAKYDHVLSRDDSPGNEMIVSETFDIYSVAFCKGSYLGGLIECEDKALAEEKAKAFKHSLPAQ